MAWLISSLRFRLIAFVLLAVVPAFGVILYGTARYRALMAGHVQGKALDTARLIGAEQERYFENAHQFLVTLARLPQVRERSGPACDRLLAGLLEPLYVDLAVFNLNGGQVCGALPRSKALVRPEAALLSAVTRTHDFSIGRIRPLPSAEKAVVDLGYPVVESPGVVRGAVVVALDFSWVARITAHSRLSPGASFTLIDDQGTVLLRHPDGAAWVGKKAFMDSSNRFAVLGGLEGAVQAIAADGVERLFAFSRLKTRFEGQTIYAAIDVPASLAFAEADRIAAYSLAALALLTAVTVLAAWFGADLLVLRRIRDLVSATRQVAAGTLTARTSLPYGRSELGSLARAFDELAETLERRDREARASVAQIEVQRLRQRVLHDLNLALMSTLDLASVLNTLLAKIAALFPCCVTTVSWIDRRTGRLEDMAYRSDAGDDAGFAETGIERGLPEVVVRAGAPVAVRDAQLDPRTTHPEFFRRYRLVSYLGLPMISQGEALGVLSLYTNRPHEFQADEVDFLMDVGTQAAMAIQNSRLYEQTRRQAEELEKSNKTKDEFLGVMSHELRTPLNIIMNYAEALRIGMFGGLGPEQTRGMEKIRSQAAQLLALINGILEITKIETGSVAVHREAVDLNKFLAELRSDYMMPSEKRLSLEWRHPDDLPALMTDRAKLKHIVTNLINNAIKFTEQGSVVVSASVLARTGELELRVADTGPGIPEELIPVVFDKFRQLDSTTTRSHSGAGLGLYIVKTFVELLGGTIRVESRLGEGSIFIVRLPLGVPSNRPGVPEYRADCAGQA